MHKYSIRDCACGKVQQVSYCKGFIFPKTLQLLGKLWDYTLKVL